MTALSVPSRRLLFGCGLRWRGGGRFWCGFVRGCSRSRLWRCLFPFRACRALFPCRPLDVLLPVRLGAWLLRSRFRFVLSWSRLSRVFSRLVLWTRFSRLHLSRAFARFVLWTCFFLVALGLGFFGRMLALFFPVCACRVPLLVSSFGRVFSRSLSGPWGLVARRVRVVARRRVPWRWRGFGGGHGALFVSRSLSCGRVVWCLVCGLVCLSRHVRLSFFIFDLDLLFSLLIFWPHACRHGLRRRACGPPLRGLRLGRWLALSGTSLSGLAFRVWWGMGACAVCVGGVVAWLGRGCLGRALRVVFGSCGSLPGRTLVLGLSGAGGGFCAVGGARGGHARPSVRGARRRRA